MITPTQAAMANDKRNAAALARAEEVIDELLKSQFCSDTSVTIMASSIPIKDYHLRNVLIQRYRNSGWAISDCDDQREGHSYTFSGKD